MGIAKVKKTTKRKPASTVQKTEKKWNRSQSPTDTPATGAAGSSESTMEESRKPGLKALSEHVVALNDIYIIEEDPIETIMENDSGLTADVVDALKSKTLIIPDAYSSFAEKYPCTGTIVSVGPKTKLGMKPGERVGYARLGVQRYKLNGKTLCDVRECDLHYAILD